LVTGRVPGVLIAVTLLATACTVNPAGLLRNGSATPTPKRVAWSDCGSGFQCGTVDVPLDYSHPNAGSIGIAINRKPATDAKHRIGSLLINPGGPGGYGVSFVRDSAAGLSNLNQRFDLVGFDPRGVGQSSPVKCLDGSQLDAYKAIDSVLDDPQEKQAYLDADKSFVAACQQQSGKVLPFVDTVSAARDIDMIRAAVGDAKLTYLGFSYGTFLGEHYAHMFPTHIRAMVLDGVIDPSLDANQQLLIYVNGFEQNLKAFLSDCSARKAAAKPCQFAQSGDPGTKLMALMQRLDTTPLVVGNRQLTRALAVTGVQSALMDEGIWPFLDQGLTNADRGNGQLLLQLADLLYGEFSYAANVAISCLDYPVDSSVASYDALTQSFQKASALFGPVWQYSNLVCANWPVKAKGTPGPLNAVGAPPVLIVGSTNDPATPYEGAVAVNKQITGSVLLTRNGNGHTAYGSSQCASQAEDVYLIDLTLPAAGTVCQ
jgi:pimeloyl-ACP methyl ester carboxylesterase